MARRGLTDRDDIFFFGFGSPSRPAEPGRQCPSTPGLVTMTVAVSTLASAKTKS
jgi:hypothetical protein